MKPAVVSTLDRATASVPAAVAVAVRPRLVVKPSTSTLLDTPAPVSVDPASTLRRAGDGVCANGTVGRPRRVSVAGPNGISITGFARCASGRNWTAVVDGGRGSVGGVTLASGAFRGTIVSTGGVVVADVRVGMGAHPRVVPAWGQRASVRLVHGKAGWSGQVTVRASRGGNRLVMAGPLLADGSYLLRARGAITFAGSPIPLSGSYLSAPAVVAGSRLVAVGPSWSIRGQGRDGVLSGVPVRSPRVAMSQAARGVTGSALLVMPPGIGVRTTLAFVDERNFVLSGAGSATAVWRPAAVPGLTVQTAAMAGTVSSERGRLRWALTTPMSIVDEKLTMSGAFDFIGPARWRLRMSSGSGSILGVDQELRDMGVAGSVVIGGGSRGTVSGSVMVRVAGSLLIDMPSGWVSASALRISFAKTAGGVVAITKSVRYAMTNKSSRLVLSGAFTSSDAFKLSVSGSVVVVGTAVPFHGTYESVGYLSGGIPRTQPYYDMSGSIADAPGGTVKIRGGAAMKGGGFGFGGGQKSPVRASLATTPFAAKLARVDATVQASSTTTIGGSVDVALSDTDSFTLACSLEYSDEDNWVLTAAATDGDPWTPFSGLTVQVNSFHGTVTSVDAAQTWDLYVDEVDWTNIATGVNMKTGFSFGTDCPLTDHCPDIDDAIYVGFTNSPIDFSGDIPPMSLTGAFTSDAAWARFDAAASNLTYNGITVSNVDLAMWKGSRDDYSPDLVMPDLSGENNGFGIEFCGNFKVDVPDVVTADTTGCIEWSPDGVVLAQAGTTGDVDGGTSSGGVTIGNTTLNGYAWTSLSSVPTVSVDGVDIELEQGRDYLTAYMDIPANVMHDVGAGDSASTIDASGWFTDGGEFSLDASIAVNMTSGGFTLNSVSVNISKENGDFALGLGADATVSVSGNHYPVSAFVGYESGSQTITVRLDVKGGVKDQSATGFDGSFDLPTLLPSGNFEPVNSTLVDGTFDAKPTQNVLADGTFENSAAQGNLVTNPDFETGVQNELMPNGDFESGSNGNILDNGDLEDGNFLVNGGLEDGWANWGLANGFSMTAVTTDNAPSQEVGMTSYTLKSTGGNTSNVGWSQNIQWAPVQNASYTLWAWAKSPDSSNSRIGLYVNQTGTASGCGTQSTATTSQIFTVGSGWTLVSLPVTGVGCRTGFTVTLDAVDAGDSVMLDSMTFVLNSVTNATANLPNTNRPSLLDRFDSYPPITASSGVTRSSDWLQSLRSGGCSSNYWYYNNNSYGYANGDFDVSINVVHPKGNGKRDMGSFGFWINGSGTGATGYTLRTQTQNGDGGFWQVGGTGGTHALNSSGNYLPDLATDQYYTLRVSSYGDWVTGTVTKTETGEQIWTSTVNVGTGNAHSGSFGMMTDSLCSSEGTHWDDFSVYRGTSSQVVRDDQSNARSGRRYLALNGNTSNYAAQYTTGEQPAVGTIYSYSAWVRSRGGNVPGTLYIETVGGTYESVAVGFTATSTWQLVTGTLRIAYGGHVDVRPGFVNMTPNTEVDVDDQVFAVAPWGVSPSNPGAVSAIVGSDAHGGTGALAFTDRNNGSSVLYDLAGWPGVGATYTVSAWIKGAVPVNGDLKITAVGGTEESAKVDFTTTSGWTQYTAQLTTNGNGHSNLRVTVDIKAGSQYQTILIDDVSVTAVGQQSDQDGSVSDLATPSGWNNTGGEVKWVNGASNAHGGMGYIAITPSGNYTKNTQYTAAATPKVGSTYTATAWVKGSGCGNGYLNGQITLSSGLESVTTSYVANPTYQQVTATLPITKSGATALTMTMANTQNSSSCYLLFDDAGIQLNGLAPSDPWGVYAGNGFISTVGIDDQSKAHGGSKYLEVKATNSSGYMYVDTAYTSTPGTQQTMTMWVRSPNGQNFYGAIGLMSYGGSSNTDDENRFVNFSTSSTQWQQVIVTLPIWKSGNTMLRTEINIDSVGVVGDIDDVISSQLSTWAPWEPTGSQVNETIVNDPTRSAGGSSYLTVNGANGGGIISTINENVKAGAVYTLSMYVRSTTGAFVDGQFGMAYNNNTEANYQYFTADADWQLVTMSLTATKSNTIIQPLLQIYGSHLLDIDTITVTPQVIIQDDPWLVRTDMNSTATGVVFDDQSRAHDSSYGVLEARKSANGDGEVYHNITASPAVGEVYTGSVWVRSASGTPVSGAFGLLANGGNQERASTGFTATGDWQLLSVRLPIAQSGHTSMMLYVDWYTNNVTLDIDDADVQKVNWVVGDSNTTAQKVMNDGEGAQSGSGYLQLTCTTNDGYVFQDSVFTPVLGASYTLKAWVRSPSGQPVSGAIGLGSIGGSNSDDDVRFQDFTTSGSDWQQVSVTVPITTTANNTVRAEMNINTAGGVLDIDTVELVQLGEVDPDGVTTPLPHPQSGYAYLWNDAFGIPGAHLWAMTAQIQFVAGKPGLGVGATMYLDPTKATGLMTGTDWLKGDMSLNISRADPCFSFGFDGTGTNARIAIDGGVFSTSKFQLNFAPRGCEVGDYVVPVGATLALDTELGDTGIHLDIEIAQDDSGEPTFYGSAAITNMVLAGTTYNSVALTIDLGPGTRGVWMEADFITTLGAFYGDLDLSVNSDKLHMEGQVSVTDWSLAGGTMDVSSFNYYESMDIPFGEGGCANMVANTSGVMKMASKTYNFTGNLQLNCGGLQVLHFQFYYSHRGVQALFGLDYSSKTKLLAGGVFFNFERSTSWKFLGHKYNRHPKIAMGLSFSMNVTKPSATLNAFLGGTISVSGGSGTLACTISSTSDDECTIAVRINSFGGHSYNDTW